jgi:hypothetical protein
LEEGGTKHEIPNQAKECRVTAPGKPEKGCPKPNDTSSDNWVEIFNPQIGRSYFMDTATNKTRWEAPPNWCHELRGNGRKNKADQNLSEDVGQQQDLVDFRCTQKVHLQAENSESYNHEVDLSPQKKLSKSLSSCNRNPHPTLIKPESSTQSPEPTVGAQVQKLAQKDAQQPCSELHKHDSNQIEEVGLDEWTGNQIGIVTSPDSLTTVTSITSPINKGEELAAGDDIVELQVRSSSK